MEGNFTFPPSTQPPRMKVPIIMSEKGDQEMYVTLLTPSTMTVDEGTPFPIQPVLQLRYVANNKPVQGLGCIASIIGKNGHIYPKGYRLFVNGENKKSLLKPIAGNYNDSYDDPLANWAFDPRKTDENGTITFEGLAFSSYGNIGAPSAVYSVEFRCGGATVSLVNYTVQSIVAKMEMKNPLSSNIIVKKINAYDFTNSFLITDSKGNGIKGKNLDKIEALDSSNQIVSSAIVDVNKVQIRLQSDDDGLLPIAIKVKFIKQGK